MKKLMRAVLCLMLATLMLAAPMEAFAATTVKIYRVNADLVRVHSTPQQGLENVIGKVRAGSKVFYLNQNKSGWWKVRTDHGLTGYIWKDYLGYYGATTLNRVYQATSSAYVYKKASTGAKKLTTIGKNEHVIVYATKGNWAAIATLSGTQGYVKKSALKKAR